MIAKSLFRNLRKASTRLAAAAAARDLDVKSELSRFLVPLPPHPLRPDATFASVRRGQFDLHAKWTDPDGA